MGCSLSKLISPHTLVSKFRSVLPGLDRADSSPCSRWATACTLAGLHIGLGHWLGVFLRLLLLAHLFNDPLWRPAAVGSLSAAGAGCAHRWSFPRRLRDDFGSYDQAVGLCRGTPRPVFLDVARMD